MAAKIDTVASRARLKPRREPYWDRVSKGCYLGFRKMTPSSEGTWVARCLDEVTGKQVYKPLGDFAGKSQRYDAACEAAEAWFEHLGKGGSTEGLTVARACENYVEHLRERGDGPADDADARFERYVLSDKKLAATEVAKLTPAHIEAWRKSLRARPAYTDRGKRRSDSTMNRDMTALRAALNLAFKKRLVTSNFAWHEELAPIEGADKRRKIYLDIEQRRKLIAAAEPALADFLRALSLVPLRPGALAALTVGQFDRRLGALLVGKDKAGGDRTLPLPSGTAKFFAALCKDKLPSAMIFADAAGRPWENNSWGRGFGKAAKLAGLPPKTTTYTLRHSVITDLMQAGVPALTVAQLSGTSMAVIEKYYGQTTGEHERNALANLAL